MHVPTAAANLMPNTIATSNKLGTNYDENKVKIIVAVRYNAVWWITRIQTIDILFRGGYTIEESTINRKAREDQNCRCKYGGRTTTQIRGRKLSRQGRRQI